jgi:hypothetical protein
MPVLGKTRRIQWSETKPIAGVVPSRVDEGILHAVHENPMDVCHYVLDVKLEGEIERVSLMIRDPLFRDRVVKLLRARGIGKSLQEIKEWPEP